MTPFTVGLKATDRYRLDVKARYFSDFCGCWHQYLQPGARSVPRWKSAPDTKRRNGKNHLVTVCGHSRLELPRPAGTCAPPSLPWWQRCRGQQVSQRQSRCGRPTAGTAVPALPEHGSVPESPPSHPSVPERAGAQPGFPLTSPQVQGPTASPLKAVSAQAQVVLSARRSLLRRGEDREPSDKHEHCARHSSRFRKPTVSLGLR